MKKYLMSGVAFGPEDGTGAAAPAAATVIPAAPAVPEAKAAPAAEPVTAAVDAEPATSPAAGETAPKTDWRDDRIRVLTAKLKEAKAAPTTPAVPTPGAPTIDSPEGKAAIAVQAAQAAAEAKFNEDCNSAAVAGRQAFTDFDDRLKDLLRVVDRSDPASVAQYNQFLAAALETGKAPNVIHALGGDLNAASRIMSLSPAKMGVELARLADREPEEISKTPKPITPVGTKGGAHTAIDPSDAERADRLSTAEWMKRRSAEVAASRKRA